MGQLSIKAAAGLLTGGIAIVLFGLVAPLPGPFIVVWAPDLKDGPSEILTIVRSGIRSPIVAAIWIFVWIAAGTLMGIRGLNFGDRVRVILGPFGGGRSSVLLFATGLVLALSAGLWELGWLWFSASAALYLVLGILLLIVGTTNVSGGY